MTFQVLFSAPYMVKAVARFRPILSQFGIELVIPTVLERLEEHELLQYAGQIDGVICGDDRFNEKVLKAFIPRLRVIAKWGTGLDSIDTVAAAKLGVKVCNTPNAFTLPVAENVLGYILCFARQLPAMDRQVKSGSWMKINGRSLTELTVGVVGVGNIGKAVIRRLRAFGCNIIATDIQPVAVDFVKENAVRMVDLDRLLAESDFISLNCDLNPTSRHLLNLNTLQKVKQGVVIINTARGPVVEEKALIEALQSGRVSGAALDVFEEEPVRSDNPLLKMNNVMLAPHNGNNSPQAWENVHYTTCRNLILGLGVELNDALLKQLLQDSAQPFSPTSPPSASPSSASSSPS